MELRIYSIQNKRYPDRIKYSLIMIDSKSKKKVLMDNHHPKGHHFHLDHKEFEYNYKNEDFKNLHFQHFGEKT